MSSHTAGKPNHLAGEKSPYLLQHAHNPVDWYPWGEEAFARAKKEDKPVFLSCGYATCHWCHVMAGESFEDPGVAAFLNDHFVAVKVDREERPDVDMVYMTACHLVSGSGGWPLSVFLTPEKAPFYAGTYFPPESRWGRPGLLQVLQILRQNWSQRRPDLEKAGREVLQAVEAHYRPAASQEPDPHILDRAYQQLDGSFDPVWGGFGPAPKFPSPHNLLFLLRYFRRSGEARALAMAEKTLQAMYRGGIYDHIGYGFARYSTDERWLVPHFEKMLYDNALLAMAYLEAQDATGNTAYGTVARQIFAYALRHMTSAEGAFFTAEDADSEGEEGKFYLWTPAGVKDVLGQDEGDFFSQAFDISPQGNFEGQNIPNLIQSRAGLFGEPSQDRLEASRAKLFTARQRRVAPGKDDKVLTAWNGLMIAALAAGTRILGDQTYAFRASRTADFLLERLRPGDRLLARYREGDAGIPAYLDDYAFLAWGLLELHQATGGEEYLLEAATLTRQMQDLFGDPDGGFFFTGRDAQDLPVRPREAYDGAMPSGNAVAVMNLLRLDYLTGDPDFHKAARHNLASLMGEAGSQPTGHTFFLCALDWATGQDGREKKGEINLEKSVVGRHRPGAAHGGPEDSPAAAARGFRHPGR
ncbi:MAG TPA: thioredoxin domain-containing protein [Spirochaetia bacterium]|nr:thioredoxin domain-containing protein [Spirochaetia bacterium]